MKVAKWRLATASATILKCHSNVGSEDGKIQKRTISMDVEDVIENWYETIAAIKHIDIKRHQYTSYQSQRDNLKPGEVLIHCDYSENYKNTQQNEIQSAYFGQSSFSLLQYFRNQ